MRVYEWIIIALLLSIVVSLAIIFMRMRRYEHFVLSGRDYENTRSWRFREAPYVFRIQEIIEAAELQFEIKLTWAARQMLVIPVVEAFELDKEVNWSDVSSSVSTIVAATAENRNDEPHQRRHLDSVAIIRAFHNRYCNIPPFCSRTVG
jgi:hypothetical protein